MHLFRELIASSNKSACTLMRGYMVYSAGAYVPMFAPYSVKFNSLDLHCCHRAS